MMNPRNPRRGNKYGAKKVTYEYDGAEEKFDSLHEFHRYNFLRQRQIDGEISELKRQVKYLLIPSQYIDKKLAEKECSYVADFEYTLTSTGEKVVEDAKGYKNPSSAGYAKFVIKRKLMLHKYGIRVREV